MKTIKASVIYLFLMISLRTEAQDFNNTFSIQTSAISFSRADRSNISILNLPALNYERRILRNIILGSSFSIWNNSVYISSRGQAGGVCYLYITKDQSQIIGSIFAREKYIYLDLYSGGIFNTFKKYN